MRLSRARAWFVWLPAAALAGVAWAPAARAGTIEIPTAVAGVLPGQGQGLCVANAVSTTPAIDFPQMAGVFKSGMNAFMEAHKADRDKSTSSAPSSTSATTTIRHLVKPSFGDFIDAMLPSCKTGGCDFFMNDTTTPFGARFRGFLNVASEYLIKATRPLRASTPTTR